MKKIFFAVLVLGLVSCASDNETVSLSAEEMYEEAFKSLENTSYKKAAEGFELLETEHPYSQWAVKAKLMGAYAYYKNEDYDDAILAADRFIKYHPGNPDAAYAYYLKGMSYYTQISAADKGQENTRNAEETFRRLMILYPESDYAKDVSKKINLTEDYQAGQEMIVGRYYLKNGNYLSALNRFNQVLEDYQTTVQIEEALYREVEIYAILGLNNYADGYYKILKTNYPDGEWTEKAGEVMEKIGKAEKKSEDKTEPEKTEDTEEKTTEEESKGWFSWLSFGSDDEEETAEEVKEAAEEVKAEAEEVAEKTETAAEDLEEVVEEATEEESKGWFSWLSFGSDDEEETAVKEAAEEVKAEAEEVAEKTEVAAEDLEEAVEEATKEEESKGWFSWLSFGSDNEGETAEEVKEAAEEVKAEVDEVAEKTETAAEDLEEAVEEATEEESKGWFSWLSFGSDDEEETVEEVAEEVEETQSNQEAEAEVNA